MPNFFLATLSMIAWNIEKEDFADRCSITLTLLLTLVAGQSATATLLPVIPYLTRFDHYANLSLGFVSIVLVEGTLPIMSNYEWIPQLIISTCWILLNVVLYFRWK